MDCDLCQIRSSIGYCAECKRLLCEMCSIACTECGKNICVTHVHETRSGKRLCSTCTKARKERQHRHADGEHHERTAFEDDEPLRPVRVVEEEEEDEDRALTASATKAIPPWKLSLYASGAAAVTMTVVLAVPTFRLVAQPWCSIISIALCAISGLWAFNGLTSPSHAEHRRRNFIGAGIAVVALLMAAAALQLKTDTRGNSELEQNMINRQGMSPAELREWRRQRLDRFAPQKSEQQQPAPQNSALPR